MRTSRRFGMMLEGMQVSMAVMRGMARKKTGLEGANLQHK
jgi:hypothetical protein